MNDRQMQIISELMEELQETMSHGEEDFNSRLGRKKPDLEMVKIEGKMDPSMDMEMDDDAMPDESMMSDDDDMMEEEGPDDRLKKRLMALRGN